MPSRDQQQPLVTSQHCAADCATAGLLSQKESRSLLLPLALSSRRLVNNALRSRNMRPNVVHAARHGATNPRGASLLLPPKKSTHDAITSRRAWRSACAGSAWCLLEASSKILRRILDSCSATPQRLFGVSRADAETLEGEHSRYKLLKPLPEATGLWVLSAKSSHCG